MKICKVCLSSDILCNACGNRLTKGEISDTDVRLSRALNKINKDRNLDLDFLSCTEGSDRIFVVVDSVYAGKFIGPGGRHIKEISSEVGKQVKLLEKTQGSERHVLEKLIGAPVLGINKIYSGSEAYSVRIERRYMKNVQQLSGVVSSVLGKKVSFVFE